MKQIDNKKAKKLLREFDKIHTEYSISVMGHFGKNWKKKLKYADLKNGTWYWKGYNLLHLSEQIDKKLDKF